MIERPCIRCRNLSAFEEGRLNYCGVCGAPQIFLSEDLQQKAAEDTRHYGERLNGTAPGADNGTLGSLSGGANRPSPPPGGSPAATWPVAVESALLSSGIALAAGIGATLFAPLAALDWLWLVSAPMLTIGFYNNRARGQNQNKTQNHTRTPLQTRPLTAGFAARLGLLTGLLVLAGSAVAFVAGMLVARFALHSHEVDSAVAAAFAQVRTTTQAQYGDAAAPVLHLLGIPEFRVGFLLWMVAVSAVLYLLYAAFTAFLAGLLLSRRRPA